MMEGFDWTIPFKLASVVVLVLANGFFVASEFALVALRRSRVEHLRNIGHPLGNSLIKASDHLDSYLAATQLGITLSSLGLGWIGEPAVAAVLEPLLSALPAPFNVLGSHAIAFVIAFTFITVLHIVFGELMPKSLAIQKAEAVSMWIVRPLAVFLIIFGPVIAVLNGFANWMLRKIGISPASGEGHLHSPEELRLLFRAASEAGLFGESQGDLVDRALTLGERKIAACMTSRQDFEWVDPNHPLAEIRKQVLASSHSRFPVKSNGADHAMGYVSAKILLGLDAGLDRLPGKAIAQASVVSENAEALDILERFRRERIEWAIVADEYGDIQGLVTTGDLFDAIAGDSEILSQKRHSDEHGGIMTEHVFDAGISMDEFRREIGRPNLGGTIGDRYHTAAGFVLEHLKRLPVPGTRFVHEGLEFVVEEMNRHRITRLTVRNVERRPIHIEDQPDRME
jgi:putative hemolysin